MKIRYFIVTLFVCTTLVSCGKKGINEDVVYDASSSLTLESNFNDNYTNLKPDNSVSQNSINSNSEAIKKIIFDSIQLSRYTDNFNASDKNVEENVNQYISNIASYVNNTVNESLDLSSINLVSILISSVSIPN